MKASNTLKVAIVHDFLIQRGGAERVLKEIADMYPDAPIYTLLYDKEKMRGMFKGRDIRPSYLQKFPKFLRKRYHWLLPFFLVVPEIFDFREFDLVISSSGAWVKGIVTKLDTTHVAYLHSPMRWVWDYNERYLHERGKKPSIATRFILSYVRMWDRLAAERPDHIIANSKYTQRRIDKYYRRESTVIYPPVTMSSAISQQSSPVGKDDRLPVTDYFLVVSRLSPYKKVDIVVEAFNKLGLPLVVIGEGQQEKYLKKIAKSNITILGWRSDEEIAAYYQQAECFIFPAEDDFGITAVEAMSHGVPVLAYKKGGACETVREGVTGEFFAAQSADVLADGVRRITAKKDSYDKDVIRKAAQEFSREKFKREMRGYIDKIMSNSKC